MSSMIDYGKYEFIIMKDIIILMMVATKTLNTTFDMYDMALWLNNHAIMYNHKWHINDCKCRCLCSPKSCVLALCQISLQCEFDEYFVDQFQASITQQPFI